MKTLGTGAFSNCAKLKKVNYPSTITTIGDQAFFRCSEMESIDVPEGVTTLGMGAFYECKKATGLKLPESLTSIASNCFYACAGITTAKIPAGVTVINSSTFDGCVNLADLQLHDGITEIGAGAFYECESLTSIKLPKNLTKISKNLFNRCAGLTEIEIPAAVTTIENNAFYLCTGLKELNISANVTSIGGTLLVGCESLQSINVADDNPNYADIDGVLVNKEGTRIMGYPGGRKSVYVMPESITAIDNYIFNSNANITGIVFSKNLKSIGISCFYGATGIHEIDLPESLETISDMAFYMNTGITSIRLPNKNVSLGSQCMTGSGITNLVFPEGFTDIGYPQEWFYTTVLTSCPDLQWVSIPSTVKAISPFGNGSSKLTTFYCFGVEPPALGAWDPVSFEAEVKVPKGTADAYAKAWGTLYPKFTYSDVLPIGAEVTLNDNSATLTWEAYSDSLYTATPVRYEITILDGETVVKENEMKGAEVTSGKLSCAFSGLDRKEYSYQIKGYSNKEQVTLLYTGEFDLASSAIDSIIAGEQSEVVDQEYYTISGQKVTHPAPSQFYIVRKIHADGSVVTTKEYVK